MFVKSSIVSFKMHGWVGRYCILSDHTHSVTCSFVRVLPCKEDSSGPLAVNAVRHERFTRSPLFFRHTRCHFGTYACFLRVSKGDSRRVSQVQLLVHGL